MVMGTLGKYNRSVSIIGVGCTPFMYTVDNPETNGLTEGEMFGYAALKAMEDAGVNPQDVDFYFHGEASPLNGSNYLTPNVQVANWFGMKGKGSIHHSEACCTGYLAIEQAVNAVASGKYNCVLTGAVEFGDSTPSPADNVESPKHPYKRDKMTLDEYMNSPYNPKMGDFLRAGGIELKCDGAAAAIVCATEMIPVIAGNLKHRPIEVLGIGSAACEATTPHFEVRATEEAVRQAYELTGLSGDDLDLFYANDFIITSHLVSAEIAGYLPYGEGWKYICEGRTAWDGDKPINTNGGRTSFGHAHAASGLADVYEACKQIWGECGGHQVKKQPRTAMLRGYGGAQNVAAVLLGILDE